MFKRCPPLWQMLRQRQLQNTGRLEAQKLYEILSDIKTETLVDALDDMVAKYKPRDTW